MISFIRILLLTVFTMCSIVGCGGGSKEVVVPAPSAEERNAQMENLTPEQRQAMEAMVEAMRAQTQDEGAAQKAAE